MEKQSLAFLKTLLETPSPSGYEQPVQKVVREFVKDFADEVTTDWHGNVTAVVNPKGSPRIMLAGHADQIGLIIKHIDKEGYLRVSPVGGWDVQMLIGQRLQVWTKKGPVPGVIARKAIHLLTLEERKTVPEVKDLWLDIGAKDEEETKSLIEIGDPVTLSLGLNHLQNNLASAPGMDNKVGVWVVMNALKLVAEANPEAAVYSVSTVQEEIGLRGAKTSAYSIDPHIGIGVDVTHATDCPSISESEHGKVDIGDGPVLCRGPNINPVVFENLTNLASENEIPYQVNALARPAGNDTNVMQVSRGGLATGIVALPNRYMHSPVEVISLDDLENAAKLIAKFCLSVKTDSDFTPC